MGINRSHSKLLDDADMNIGNQVPLLGGWLSTQMISSPNQNPDRIINLAAESNTAQMVTVALAAFTNPPLNQDSGLSSLAGPLTAIIEFGNGAQTTKAEVDVPVGQTLNIVNTSNAADGGTLVTVPAGTLRVYGRNDSNLITPSASFNGSIQFGNPNSGDPAHGSNNIPRGFGPWWANFFGGGLPNTSQVSPVPATMKAMATYFTRPSGQRTRNTKTIWVYNSLPDNGVDIVGAAGQPAIYFIPAFAKSVRVLRNSCPDGDVSAGPACSVTLTIYDQTLITQYPIETFAIAAGAASPTFEIPMSAVAVGVLTGTALTNSFALEFEIGI